MSTPDMTIGGLPADQPNTEQGASRRKKALLLILLGSLGLLLLLTGWYLLFRKPITEIPLPVIEQPMPAYQYSLYDLSKPQSVAVSADGSKVYVTQTGAVLDTVLLDGKGTKLATLTPPADLIAQAHQLFLAVNPVTSEVWATDRYNSAVVIYTADGTFSRIFDQGVGLADWQPLAIAFDKAGQAFVADVATTKPVIHVFGTDGKLVKDIGADQSLDHPNGIAVADDGTIYVTDTANGRLQILDKDGKRLGLVDRGNAAGNLGLPVGVAFDDKGRVVVVDSSGARVQVYAQLAAGERGPKFINSFGDAGTADSVMKFPNGLAADGRGRLYVADWGNDRLEIWSY